jgi:hypothetical protein
MADNDADKKTPGLHVTITNCTFSACLNGPGIGGGPLASLTLNDVTAVGNARGAVELPSVGDLRVTGSRLEGPVFPRTGPVESPPQQEPAEPTGKRPRKYFAGHRFDDKG